jgi:cytochrome d ubiquinol oxidase subunit II
MVELWFGLLCFMLTMFVVLDGWNIGAGVLHLIVGKTGSERRGIIAALGPLWSWHEVWLLAFGGTFLLAFPGIMATSFAGFYLALWFVLWSLLLRGVSIEVGGHIHDRLWQSWWDFVFAVSSAALAVLFGAALGNVIRGVPLDATGKFSMSLFTDFGVRGHVGILDWYTVSVAVLTTVLLAAHGATYLRLKTTGPVHQRSERLARRLWTTAFVLFPVISLETWFVRPALFTGMIERPAAWLAVAVVLAGSWALVTGFHPSAHNTRAGDPGLRGTAESRAFAGSCAVIAGLLAGAAAGVFPVMLYSTLGSEHSMTAYNGAAPAHGLALALIWWPVATVLALTYFTIIARNYRGKVPPAQDTQAFY